MCTAVSFCTKNTYFGRNLDLEYSYEERVVIAPRGFVFPFLLENELKEHYAMIGTAYVAQGYPLFYDAMNEKGIGMAGLAFAGNAVYRRAEDGWNNIAPHELIPWVLGQCATMEEVRNLLTKLRVVDLDFSGELKNTPLHWMISDGRQSIVVEAVAEGVRFYSNTIGVLTNNPPFPYQMLHLSNYMRVTRRPPETTFADDLQLEVYSRGMGGLGLPGDLSSPSRFVRAAFVRMNSVCGESEEESVNQFFHILTSVEQQKGCVLLADNQYEYTVYSSCCSLQTGKYYYTTYENRSIRCMEMRESEKNGSCLILGEILGET